MALIFKAPEPIKTTLPRLFLGGTIDMNRAERWQDDITQRLSHLSIAILNPRRDVWDNSWQQRADHPKLREQVIWELEAQEKADVILYYFQPGTQSPVTLLELGLFHRKAMVCCPERYWRKGNVDLVCERYKVPMVPTLEDFVEEMKRRF